MTALLLGAGLALYGGWLVRLDPTPRGAAQLAGSALALTSLSLLVESTGSRTSLGLWFAGLLALYTAHTVAALHWGGLISLPVLRFGLRHVVPLVRAFRVMAAGTLLLLACAYVLLWLLLRDAVLLPPGAGLTLAAAAMAAAGALRAVRLFSPRLDPLLGFVIGCGRPPVPLPPYRPELGRYTGPAAPAAPAKHVILIVVDSLRADRMSLYGYARATTPLLERHVQAHQGRVVPMAISSGPSSELALWSLLTSRPVSRHAVNAPTLHEVLAAHGYASSFLLGGTHLGWMGLEHLYGRQHADLADSLTDGEIVERLDELRGDGDARPRCVFLFLMSTHASAPMPPAYWAPQQHRYDFLHTKRLTDEARARINNHYDNAVREADRQIDACLARLERQGLLRDALVVVSADHGESLAEREGTPVGHARDLYQESIRIPLVLWDTSGPLPPLANLCDQTAIAPTVLEHLGIPPPPGFEGHSLFASAGSRRAHSELTVAARDSWNGRVRYDAVIEARDGRLLKSMRVARDGDVAEDLSFDLSADPGEQAGSRGACAGEVSR